MTGIPSAAYNPLDRLSPDSLDLGEDAASLTEALVMDAPGQVSEAHWNEEAKAILGGLIMFCVCREEKNRRALATVREYLTLPPERLRALLELMQDSDAANGLVAAPRRQPVSGQGGPRSGLGPVERTAPHPLSGQSPHCQSSVAVGFPLLGPAPPDHLGVSGAAAQQNGRLQPLAAPAGLLRPSMTLRATLRQQQAQPAP